MRTNYTIQSFFFSFFSIYLCTIDWCINFEQIKFAIRVMRSWWTLSSAIYFLCIPYCIAEYI